MKKEYLIQLPLVYRWVMTVTPSAYLGSPPPPTPIVFHSELLLVFFGNERYDQAFDEELQSSLQLGGLEGASVEVEVGGDSIATAFTPGDSRGGTWGPFGIVLLGPPILFLLKSYI